MVPALWYLSDTALDILASGRPDKASFSKAYPLTIDRWAEFTGPVATALHGVFAAAFAAAGDDMAVRMDVLTASPEDVLGALWGDPNGNAAYRTYRDTSDEWALIRSQVVDALAQQVAA